MHNTFKSQKARFNEVDTSPEIQSPNVQTENRVEKVIHEGVILDSYQKKTIDLAEEKKGLKVSDFSINSLIASGTIKNLKEVHLNNTANVGDANDVEQFVKSVYKAIENNSLKKVEENTPIVEPSAPADTKTE